MTHKPNWWCRNRSCKPNGDDDIPFLCIAGVREYHEHPAHSGDRWESYRTSGAGRLVRLVQVISKYGLETIDGFEVQFVPKVRFHSGVPTGVNTFESIREFVVPADLCDATDRQLREAGLDGNERFILWSGVVRNDRLVVRTLHCPKQTAYHLAGGLCVRVEADELHRLNVWLYENAERLAIQVHSHPTEAFPLGYRRRLPPW